MNIRDRKKFRFALEPKPLEILISTANVANCTLNDALNILLYGLIEKHNANSLNLNELVEKYKECITKRSKL